MPDKASRRARPDASTGSFTEQVTAAQNAALRLLGVRERSQMELRIRLKRKGFSPDAIVAALGRLEELRLQSDERFAERYAEASGSRGNSQRRIQQELRARGVPPEVAAAASAGSDDDDRDRALAFASRRVSKMTTADPATIQRRLTGMLARRGYDADTCRWAVETALERSNLDPVSERDVP